MIQHVWQMAAALMIGMAAPAAAWAQPAADSAPPAASRPLPDYAAPAGPEGLPVPMITSCPADAGCGCGPCDGCAGGPSLYASFDFLLARPHFSEAVAFASVDGAPPLVDAREIDFGEVDYGYEPSFRLRMGTWLDGGTTGLRASYWHFDGDVEADGVATGTTLLVDPFGNLVGNLPGIAGDRIDTESAVRMNVFDIEFISTHDWNGGCTSLAWTVGARIADVDQTYESLTSLGGAPLSFGDFSAEFIGAGPRIGLEATHRRNPCSSLALFASAHGSLLLGEYNVESSNTNVVIAALNGGQEESPTRTIPVIEMELGATWQAADRWSVAGGWMIQAWFDLGTSGGRFENPAIAPIPLFTGADDSNIMSFDGFFLRAEMGF